MTKYMHQGRFPITPERLAEIKEAAGKLTYEPTRRAAEELIAEVERLQAEVTASHKAIFRLISQRDAKLLEALKDA